MSDPALPSDVDMRAFLLRYIQDAKHREMITVPAENERDFLVLFGLVQRVRRLAQAYLRLDRAGFANEASVLIRAALEHAVTAQWAYFTPGGVDRLHVTLARAQGDLAGSITSYEGPRMGRTRTRTPQPDPLLPALELLTAGCVRRPV